MFRMSYIERRKIWKNIHLKIPFIITQACSVTASLCWSYLLRAGVSVACSLSGLPWWWPAPGGTSTSSRSCCAMVLTPRWGTKTAGTPSTSPAGRAIPWSYSTCSLSHRTSGGRRARRAELRCTLPVRHPLIPGSIAWIRGVMAEQLNKPVSWL